MDSTPEDKQAVSLEVTLKPKVSPQLSCPKSVLYLPYVIEGIKNGEIIVEINQLNQ